MDVWHSKRCAGNCPITGSVAVCSLNFTLILISPLLLMNSLNGFSVTLLEKVVIQENVSPVRLDAGLVSVSMANGTTLKVHGHRSHRSQKWLCCTNLKIVVVC